MRRLSLTLVLATVTACAGQVVEEPAATTDVARVAVATPTTTTSTTTSPTTTTVPATTTTLNPHARPDWLGTRPLPLRPDGHGEVQPTPEELVDRQLETVDLLEPPETSEYRYSIESIPDEVLARSSWVEECPVAVDELRYLTMTHHGFDGEAHTGEMIVNAAVAEDVVEVFRKLYDARFPIESMRVIRLEEVDDHPTGDWNETTSFVCRPAVGSTNWSYHAYGLAIDVNPFHNPYVKGDLVIPELASAYVDREYERVGMIHEGDVVTEAFAEAGWEWGGNWDTLKDWMHFSTTGR
ncbi:MAG: M15 family metallopeptidase [Actinomycetota bacterium]